MAERREVHVATGKRKSAVARIRMSIGEGRLVVNQRTLEDYFGRETSRMIVHQPFELTNTRGQYDLSVNVGGGGVSQRRPPRGTVTRVRFAGSAKNAKTSGRGRGSHIRRSST